jgi:hypothetical protein
MDKVNKAITFCDVEKYPVHQTGREKNVSTNITIANPQSISSLKEKNKAKPPHTTNFS